jgi:hypothetical protein
VTAVACFVRAHVLLVYESGLFEDLTAMQQVLIWVVHQPKLAMLQVPDSLFLEHSSQNVGEAKVQRTRVHVWHAVRQGALGLVPSAHTYECGGMVIALCLCGGMLYSNARC